MTEEQNECVEWCLKMAPVTRPDLLTTPCIDHGRKGNEKGYGYTSYLGKGVYLHRLVYMQKYCITNLPSWAHIMHICDNPRCVNPEHLQLGNAKLNALDMVQKGRNQPARGESSKIAKVSTEQVIGIYTKYASGEFTQSELGAMYGLDQGHVHCIVKGKSWKHLNLESIHIPRVGETHARAKLSDEQVTEIYNKYTGGGYTIRGLGKLYGVSHPVICRIVQGKVWKHLNLGGR